ncbi:MAG TPA: hypothetical protein VHP14_09780 [Anaerolineales bacterium]|nr:hypothetical protein [Anaerolineales bacterium]
MRENIIELLKNSFIAGAISAFISFLLNYYLLPFPVTLLDNAIGHGVGGFMCGFISALVGLLIYSFHRRTQMEMPGSRNIQ